MPESTLKTQLAAVRAALNNSKAAASELYNQLTRDEMFFSKDVTSIVVKMDALSTSINDIGVVTGLIVYPEITIESIVYQVIVPEIKYNGVVYSAEEIAANATLAGIFIEGRSNSISPKVVAAFSVNHTTGAHPLGVVFSDASTGGVLTWSWEFGDGNSSILQNPAHSYSAAGTYTVTLTVTNKHGVDVLTKVNHIVVS